MTQCRREGYLVSDDPARLDLDLIHRLLADESYRAEGRPRDVVQRSIANSINLRVEYSELPDVSRFMICYGTPPRAD
ncbi:MAG: hypothetical protein H0U11_04800 [Chloroflexi bacterium]|nr:hypothetical protein [Chloroflexota bacterium]